MRNAIEVRCDLETDGGGWTRLARVGPALAARLLDGNTYRSGTLARRGTEWVVPCGRLAGLDGSTTALSHSAADSASTPVDVAPASPSRVVLRVTMGDAIDYFRPALREQVQPNGPKSDSESDSGSETSRPTLCEMLGSNSMHEWYAGGAFRRDMVGGQLSPEDVRALSGVPGNSQD